VEPPRKFNDAHGLWKNGLSAVENKSLEQKQSIMTAGVLSQGIGCNAIAI
jgi:hypothetical protein